MKAAEFVGMLFLARDIAHNIHLSTRSFAKHSALGTFYEEIIPLADKFAEVYQGKHGLIGNISLQGVKSTGNITEFLQAQVGEIVEGRSEASKNGSELQNIIDEILGLYYSTIYKLRFLS